MHTIVLTSQHKIKKNIILTTKDLTRIVSICINDIKFCEIDTRLCVNLTTFCMIKIKNELNNNELLKIVYKYLKKRKRGKKEGILLN